MIFLSAAANVFKINAICSSRGKSGVAVVNRLLRSASALLKLAVASVEKTQSIEAKELLKQNQPVLSRYSVLRSQCNDARYKKMPKNNQKTQRSTTNSVLDDFVLCRAMLSVWNRCQCRPNRSTVLRFRPARSALDPLAPTAFL